MLWFTFILCCLIWGTTWIAIKLGVDQAPPYTLSSARFLIAVVCLFVIGMIRKVAWPTDLKAALRIAVPGLFMYGLSYGMLYSAERWIDSSLASVLFASFPFVVASLSLFMLTSERLSLIGWAGLVIGFGGVVLISFDSIQLSETIFWGCLLTIGSTVTSAFGLMLHKKWSADSDIIVAATLQMGAGGLLVALFALATEDVARFPLNGMTVGTTLYLALFGSVIAFLCYYWLLKRASAMRVSLIAFVTPVVAVAIGVLAFGESLTRLMLIGSGMILIGVALVLRK